MSRDAQRLSDYIDHIIESIARIKCYTDGIDADAFISNTLIQDAVLRNIENLGEASNNIMRRHPEFASAHPDIPFLSAYEMRNAVAHGYSKVDNMVVWQTIQRDLPGFLEKILTAQQQADEDKESANRSQSQERYRG